MIGGGGSVSNESHSYVNDSYPDGQVGWTVDYVGDGGDWHRNHDGDLRAGCLHGELNETQVNGGPKWHLGPPFHVRH